MQIILVTRTLEDRWPLGDIAFGVFAFAIGQVILYAFSTQICNAVQHYLDGLFFATICNLLAVMMVYKVSFHIKLGFPPTVANVLTVLGFNHKRRPRIFGGNKAEQLGSQRTPTR
jgi:hypothetical protein